MVKENTSKEHTAEQFEKEKQGDSDQEGGDINGSDSETEQLESFDVGTIKQRLSREALKSAIARGPPPNPTIFPQDKTGRKFPKKIWQRFLKNNESDIRDWLVWSEDMQALYCFSCRLFIEEIGNISGNHIGHLISNSGWSVDFGWINLYRSVPLHENSNHHKECYLR